MPARNTAAYVGAALESVLTQTYDDLEVIVIEDGSTDGTNDVAQQYARRDARVRIVRGTFGSPAAARNRGIAASSGDWFALLDSDDLWTPLFLERQFQALARYPGAMLASSNALNLGGQWHRRPLDGARQLRTLGFTDLLRDETSVCIMTVFSREVVNAVGPFDATFNRTEDYDLWLRATHAGFLIVKNPESLAYYRRRPESLSFDEEAMLDGILRVYRKVEQWSLLAEDRTVLERQIARFERRRLIVKARRALASRDFATAADLFDVAARRDGGWKPTLAAFAMRHWPESVFRVMQFRDRQFNPTPPSGFSSPAQ